ncbi:unnamed protein product, partial [Adineta steineri]
MKVSRRNYWMKLGMICCIISIMIFVMIIVAIVHRYSQLLKVSPLTSKAFWEDNRTLSRSELLPSPIITIDKVNLTNLTLVITACCRNVEKYLIPFQNNIRAIGNLFGNYKIYLGESDSQDGTLKVLRQWAKNDSNHVSVFSTKKSRWKLYL